ncbi:MAG: hypothetical protein ACK40G_01150 [Cytophagaceae bacterium]
MYNKIKWTLLCIAALLLSSCAEVLEKSIEKESINVYTPSTGVLKEYVQNFWWEKLENATSYQVMIASPNFTNPVRLVLDTTLVANRFTYSFEPGDYEWRIRGVNGSTQTAFTNRTFTIDTASLAESFVVLTKPAHGSFINTKTAISFSWVKLFGANKYQFQMDTVTSFDSQLLHKFETSNAFYSRSVTEGKYYWRVRACSVSDTSQWSPEFLVTVDYTKPNKPVLSSPGNEAGTVTNAPASGTLTWQAVPNDNIARYYVGIKKGAGTEQVTTTAGTSLSYSGSPGEEIQWRVEAEDEAGNRSGYTNSFKFKIQQ